MKNEKASAPLTAPVGSLDKLNPSRKSGGWARDNALPVEVNPPDVEKL